MRICELPTYSEGTTDLESCGEDLEQFRICIDHGLAKLERDTGLKFFDKLDRAKVTKPSKLMYDFG